MTTVADVVAHRRLVLVAGTGGVGKTTVAAALGVALADRGRRVVVLTVDPARRLASALGLTSLTVPVAVEGSWPGELWATQLDAGATFDSLLERYGAPADVTAAIRANPVYRSLAGALGATQEYMAIERVHELLGDGYDAVVVDTPPTRNAVDLLDAPARLLRFLRHPVVRALMVPTRLSLRAASVASAALLRTLGTVVGTEVVSDVLAFFQAFAALHPGFVERAAAMDALLHAPDAGFVLVTTPRADAMEESRWFADQLDQRGLTPTGVVCNLVHPSFTALDPERLPVAEGVAGAHLDNLRDLERRARHDRAALAVLTGASPDLPVAVIPLAAAPPTDVRALAEIAREHL